MINAVPYQVRGACVCLTSRPANFDQYPVDSDPPLHQMRRLRDIRAMTYYSRRDYIFSTLLRGLLSLLCGADEICYCYMLFQLCPQASIYKRKIGRSGFNVSFLVRTPVDVGVFYKCCKKKVRQQSLLGIH